MSHGYGPANEPDDKPRAADDLIDRAGTLLRRRHRAASTSAPGPFMSLDEDDLPLLTDAVDPSELPDEAARPPLATAAAHPAEVHPPSATATAGAIREAHDDKTPANPPADTDADTVLRQAVEAWFETEFPQLLSRELDAFATRLQDETLARLRASLLAAPSRRVDNDDAEADRSR